MQIWVLTALTMGVFCTVLAHSAEAQSAGDSYLQQIETWRTERAAKLKAEGGWLSVAGLYWLKEGKNTLGTGADNDVVLPAGSAPASVGVATLNKDKVTLKVAEGVTATVTGKTITERKLKSDKEGKPDRVVINALTLTIIQRGKRIGIRLYDNNARNRREFTGLNWYPVDPAYRVKAKFVPYQPVRTIPITNILGDTEDTPCPGYLVFTLNGKECRLDVQAEGDGLFINFKDQTSGKTTYPPGRFLDAPKPENGTVMLDFNQAYNPPCSFTAFATCPLPPRQNHLEVAIPAGEKTYHASHPK